MRIKPTKVPKLSTSQAIAFWGVITLLLFTAWLWTQYQKLQTENEKLWIEVLKYESKEKALDNMWQYERAEAEWKDWQWKHSNQ